MEKKLFAIFLVFSFVFWAGCTNTNPNSDLDVEFEPSKPSLDRTNYPAGANGGENITAYEPTHPMEIAFLDVGFGDATLIRMGDKTILFDAGPDTDASHIKDYLRAHGVVSLDLLILSSSDKLFSSGALDIMRSVPVEKVWVSNSKLGASSSWDEIISLASTFDLTEVTYGDKYEDGDFSLTVLNPFPGTKSVNPATDSIVLKAQYKDFCAVLFSGSEASGASGNDAGTVFGGVDNRVISGPIDVECEVLRVSAHGSGNSASFQLLDSMGPPKMAVISVGPNPPVNKYPEPTLIRRLLLRNIDVYLTDRLGDVVVKSSGSGYDVETTYPVGTDYAKFINDVGYGSKGYYR